MRVLLASLAVALGPCLAVRGDDAPDDWAAQAASPPPVQAHAAGKEAGTRLARSGDAYLVVWQDDRRQRDGVLHAVAAVRVTADGKRLDAAPLVIRPAVQGTFPAPTVAGCSGAWLVAWQEGDGLHAARVLADGRVDEVAGPIGPSGLDPTPEVACAGDTALVVWQHLGGTGWQPLAARVSVKEAKVVATGVALAAVEGAQLMRPRVASDGKRFLVVWEDMRANGSQHRVYGVRVEADGRVADERTLLLSGDFAQEYAPRVAGGGGQFMVAWKHGAGQPQQVYAQPVPGEGRLTHAQVLVGEESVAFPVVGWDGELFHVAWRLEGKLRSAAVRAGTADVVVPLGVLLPEPPVPPGLKGGEKWTGGAVDVAGGGGRAFVVWEEPILYRPYPNGWAEWLMPEDLVDVRGAVVASGGHLGEAAHLSAGPASQHSPAAAGHAGQWLVAWTELRDRRWGVYASRFDGRSFLDGPGFPLWSGAALGWHPAVAASPAGYLVAWQEPGRMLAVRVGRDGAVLDAQPVHLSSTGGHAASASFDGAAYVVAWVNDGQVQSARVAPQGPAGSLGTTPVSERYPDVQTPSVGCHPGSCLVLWTVHAGGGQRVEGTVLAPGARPGPGRPSRRIYASGRHATAPHVAAMPGGYLAAWEEQEGGGRAQPNTPMLRTLGLDGAPQDEADELSGAVGELLYVTLAWHEGGPLAAWSEGEGLLRHVVLSKGGSPEVLAPGSEARLAVSAPGEAPLLVWRAGGRVWARVVGR